MDWEAIAQKIIPTLLILIVGAIFTMYMNVSSLMTLAENSVKKSEKQYEKYDKAIRACEKDDIIQNKEIEYLKLRVE